MTGILQTIMAKHAFSFNASFMNPDPFVPKTRKTHASIKAMARVTRSHTAAISAGIICHESSGIKRIVFQASVAPTGRFIIDRIAHYFRLERIREIDRLSAGGSNRWSYFQCVTPSGAGEIKDQKLCVAWSKRVILRFRRADQASWKTAEAHGAIARDACL